MHITVPNTMVPSARFGLPAVRRKLFRPMPSDWKTKPTQMICTNVLVGSHSSALVPMSARMGSIAATAATATSTASPHNSTAEFPSVFSTCALRPSPSWMAASALPPWPATMEKPMRMVMTGSASVVTATPVPSGNAWPRKAVSTTL